MPTFTDSLDRQWSLSLNLSSARRLKEAGVDVQDALDASKGLLQRLFVDPFEVGRIAWILCLSQAEERGLTEGDFEAGLDGNAIERAREAVVGAIMEFFPRERREALRKWLESAQAVDSAMIERAVRKLDAIDIDALAERELSSINTLEARSWA